jgi:hypothetical protein
MRPGSNPIADGLAFIIQADPRGPSALGGFGGAFGYSMEPGSTAAAIVNSVAIKFDAYKPSGNHSSTGLYVSGHRPNNPPNTSPGDQFVDLAGTPIDFNAAAFANPAHSFRVTLSYHGTTLREVITDLTTNQSVSHDYPVNLAQYVGAATAYVGFGGGTGGSSATVEVQNWTFSSVQTATHLGLTGPAGAGAGTPFPVAVSALDAADRQVPAYRGTVAFTSTDPQALLPASYTYTAADAGAHDFNLTLKTAGTQTVAVRDVTTGALVSRFTVTVAAGAADHFAVTTTAANPDVAGTPFDVTVTVQDAYGNTIPGYTGTVHFSSADPYPAALPADYAFTAADAGTHTFAAGATLFTAGPEDVTAADAASGLSGTTTVTVLAAPAAFFYVAAPANASSGAAFDVTVYALDPYGNIDTNYGGTVTFGTSDTGTGVVLPPSYTFQPSDAGVVTFAAGVALVTAGDQALTVTDLGGLTGSATVTVT